MKSKYGRKTRRRTVEDMEVEKVLPDSVLTKSKVRKIVYDYKQRKVAVAASDGVTSYLGESLPVSVTIGEGLNVGIDRGSRTSYTIRVNRVRFQYEFFNPNTTVKDFVVVRLLVLKCKRPSETDLKDDLFESNSTELDPVHYTTNNPAQLRYHINRDRYTVLSDRLVPLSPNDPTEEGGHFKKVDYSVKVDTVLRYNKETLASLKIMPQIKFVMFVQSLNPSETVTSHLQYQFKRLTYYTDGK